MRKVLLVLSVFLLLATGLTAQAQAKRLKVLASFSILADVARNVAGDAADVTSLMPIDADPHEYTPTSGDLAAVADADVVLIDGPGLEQGLLKTLESATPNANLLPVSECVEVLPFGGTVGAGQAAATAVPDEAAAARCDKNIATLSARHVEQTQGAVAPLGKLYQITCASGEGGEIPVGACDPHVWFDPYNVELWTLYICDTLSALDPANAAVYAQNTTAYLDQVEALNRDVTAQVAALPVERRVLVTNHDALGYFANAYNFQIVGLVIPSVSTLAEPSAAQVAQLIDTIRAQHVPAVFAENTVSPALAQQVADEAGAKFYQLYTDSLSSTEGPASTYLDYLRADVQTMVTALS